MKKLLAALALAFVFFAPISAHAATCFWVGGTGNWDNANTASWSSSTGGSGGTCAATGGIPKQNPDVATFDANSCAGACTITVCGASSAACPSGAGSVNLGTAGAITFGACTNGCVLDFSVNNPSVSVGTISGTGTGTRTLRMGSGTWNVNRGAGATVWDFTTTTGLTFTPGTSTLSFNGTGGSSFRFGNVTYGAVSFGPDNTGGEYNISSGTGFTFSTMQMVAPVNFRGGAAATTINLTAAPTWTGTASAPIKIETGSAAASVGLTFSITSGTPSLAWSALREVTFTGGSPGTATSSLDLGGNSGITITAPTGGGATGGYIIGGN